MTNIEHEPKILQRPDLGIETIEQAEVLVVSQEDFPWITDETERISTVKVTLEDGETSFRYGSLISANSGIEGLAHEVPAQQSKSAERGMFKALAALLNGQHAPSVDNMTQFTTTNLPVYKTSKKGSDAPRLYFALSSDESGEPVVLKLGVAKHKKQDSLLAILKGKPGTGRKKDGAKR